MSGLSDASADREELRDLVRQYRDAMDDLSLEDRTAVLTDLTERINTLLALLSITDPHLRKSTGRKSE